MPVTKYNTLLLAEIEVTPGVDPLPVPASDAVRVRSAKISVTPDVIENPVVKQTMGKIPHLIGGKSTMQIEIEVALKGSGAAGTVPEVGRLLNACGHLQTISAGVSVAYDPQTNTDLHKTMTLYWYEDGLLWKFIGAIGKHNSDAGIGAAAVAKFTFSAPFLAPTAVACPTGAVYQASAPIVMSSADVVNDGAVIKCGAVGLEGGEELFHHYVTGLNKFSIVDRNAALKITKDSISTAAEWTALLAGTNTTLSATLGAAAGNRVVLTAPVMRRRGVAPGLRGDLNTLELSYGLYESAGDDQYRYLFN